MRALRFEGTGELRVTTRETPVPAPDDVLIEVIATGICGSDLHGYSGETDRRQPGQIMGHETVGRTPAGTIVVVNPKRACGTCTACSEGESQGCAQLRVIGVAPELDGSFAEFLAVPAPFAIPLNPTVPVLHGALVEPLAVGYHALRRAVPAAGDSLLVLGGGPIGQAVAIAAARVGIARVLVSERLASRREILRRLGIDACDPAELVAARDDVLGAPASIVVDAVGITATFEDAIAHSSTRARIVLVGMGATTMQIAPYGISTAERSVIGSYCYSDAHFRDTAAWVGEGHPELDVLIDAVVSLDDAPAAFRRLAAEPEGGKTLVRSR